jgi:hypothetical protein
MRDPQDVGKIRSAKEFVTHSSELLDSEAQQVMRVMYQIQAKYARRPNTVDQLEALRDETLTRLMDIGIIATVDPTPCFYGEPPVVEIVGKVPTDNLHKYGFDHEQKQYEVQKAVGRGEEFLGEKESVNTTPAQKKNKKQ